ncbi:MAG: hypothetical protein SV375_09555, partial [Thermodesulfobacteriota bacterium]|nr:hypothetical protein [Thermodesulfobacteriota bacterium]
MKSLIFQKNNHEGRLSSFLLRIFILSFAFLNSVFLFPGLPLPGRQPVYILRAQTQGHDTFKDDADALLEEGIMYLGRGDSGPALRSLQRALELYREIKDPLGEGNALKNI